MCIWIFLNHSEGIYCLDVDDEEIYSLDDFMSQTNCNVFSNCPWTEGNTKGIHIYLRIKDMVEYTSELDVFEGFKEDLLKKHGMGENYKKLNNFNEIPTINYEEIKYLFNKKIVGKISNNETIQPEHELITLNNEIELYIKLGLENKIFEKFDEKDGYTKWLNIGFLIKDALKEEGKILWLEVCKVLYPDKYDGEDESFNFYNRLNKSIKSESKKQLTIATLVKYYKDADKEISKKIIKEAKKVLNSKDDDDDGISNMTFPLDKLIYFDSKY